MQYVIADVTKEILHTFSLSCSAPRSGGEAVLGGWGHDNLALVTSTAVRIVSTLSGQATFDIPCSLPLSTCRDSMAFGREMFVLSSQGQVQVYSTKTYTRVHSLQASPSVRISPDSFSPSGTLLALPSSQQNSQPPHGLCIMTAQTMLPVPALALDTELHTISWSPTGASLALVSKSNVPHRNFVTRIVSLSFPPPVIDL